MAASVPETHPHDAIKAVDWRRKDAVRYLPAGSPELGAVQVAPPDPPSHQPTDDEDHRRTSPRRRMTARHLVPARRPADWRLGVDPRRGQEEQHRDDGQRDGAQHRTHWRSDDAHIPSVAVRQPIAGGRAMAIRDGVTRLSRLAPTTSYGARGRMRRGLFMRVSTGDRDRHGGNRGGAVPPGRPDGIGGLGVGGIQRSGGRCAGQGARSSRGWSPSRSAGSGAQASIRGCGRSRSKRSWTGSRPGHQRGQGDDRRDLIRRRGRADDRGAVGSGRCRCGVCTLRRGVVPASPRVGVLRPTGNSLADPCRSCRSSTTGNQRRTRRLSGRSTCDRGTISRTAQRRCDPRRTDQAS